MLTKKEISEMIEVLKVEKTAAVKEQAFVKAAKLRDKIEELEAQLATLDSSFIPKRKQDFLIERRAIEIEELKKQISQAEEAKEHFKANGLRQLQRYLQIQFDALKRQI